MLNENNQCILVVHCLIYHFVQIVRMLVHLTTRAPPSWSNSCASELFAHHDILDDEQRECIDYFINNVCLRYRRPKDMCHFSKMTHMWF